MLFVLLGFTVHSSADANVSNEEGLASVQTGRRLLALSETSTSCNVIGGVTLEFLDRHNINCGDNTDARLIAQWQQTPNGCSNPGDQKYVATCASVDHGFDSSSCVGYNTPANEVVGKDMAYLDRHNVNCPAGKGMKKWHLNNHKIDFTCCDIPNYQPFECYEYSSQCDSRGNLEYMDRYNINCGRDGMVLTRWYASGQNCPGGQTRFAYNCCKLQAAAPSPPPPTPPPPTDTCASCTPCAAGYGYKNLC